MAQTGTTSGVRSPDRAPVPIVAVPVRHRGRTVGAIAVLLVIAWFVVTVARNKNFAFGVVPDYLFDGVVLRGVGLTVVLTCAAMALGLVLGVVAAVWRLSPNPVFRRTSGAYVWFFRGTPVLVQLVFWFNIGIVFPHLSLGVPFTDLTLVSTDTNTVVTPLVAAILGLGLNAGAYIAEIVRAGIISVGSGQVDAARALGMDRRLTMRRIVLPQAIPVAIPPLGNEFIGMLKYSALASVIAVQELLGSVENIYSTNLRTLELLVVASIWYLFCTTVLSFGQQLLERRFSRGRGGMAQPRPWLPAALTRRMTGA
jgi:polar amino acid transport system permease protein